MDSTHPGIEELLPHRYPFLFIDRLLSVENGRSARGLYEVPEDHPFINRAGDMPVFPSFLVVEALAQIAAVCIRTGQPAVPPGSRPLGYLARIDHCSFDRPVHAGEQLMLAASLTASYGTLFKFDVACRVLEKTAVRAALTLHIDL